MADPRLPHLLLDLGEVLVSVDKRRLLDGVARLADCDAPRVEQALFGSGLKEAFDLGQIGPEAFWRGACRHLGRAVPFLSFAQAYTDLFAPITPTLELVAKLRRQGHRAYLLTNTDPLHLSAIRSRWPAIADLDGLAASFDLGLAKPDPRYFDEALRRLGLQGRMAECVFVDDRRENVSAARRAGLAAVLARTPEAVRAGLTAAGASPGDG